MRPLESLIPPKFFDTHIHGAFPHIQNTDLTFWKTGSMVSGYFFETGLNLKSLDVMYPFSSQLSAVVLPIPYGPVAALDVNENLLDTEAHIPRVRIALRGDIQREDIPKLRQQMQSHSSVIGLKIYQHYHTKSTTAFLKKSLYPELLQLAEKQKSVLFIHTNNLTLRSLDFLETVLRQYKHIRIVLTHAGVPLRGYNSFDLSSREKFESTRVNEKNIRAHKSFLKKYEPKVRRIAKMPRLFVNTAFLANEILLYAIFKHLASSRKIIFGSDLPFAYASRFKAERDPYPTFAPQVCDIFQGKTTQSIEKYHENLAFFLRRIEAVSDFLFPEATEQVFREILWETPSKLIGMKEALKN